MNNILELWRSSHRTMQFIDTHCHLYLEEFNNDIQQVVQRAIEKGVEGFYLPNIDSGSVAAMMKLENDYQGLMHPMIGLHPCSVKENWKTELQVARDWLEKRKFSGIGEVGLDFYWDRSFDQEQIMVFEEQIRWALEFSLPLAIHSRESIDACIRLVRNQQNGNLKGVFHCFAGSPEQAKEIIESGFFLGIGGVVTYKNGGLDGVLGKIGLERLVLETDAPYLSPVPFRGKRNESSYIPLIAEKIGSIMGIPVEEVARVTTANAKLLFNA